MIVELKRAGLPLAMINGRISERSFNRWRKAPRLIGGAPVEFRPLPGARRGRRRAAAALGAPRVLVAGDIKFDAPALPADRRELAELSGLTSGRQIWVAASTHEGEELIAAEAHKRLRQVFPDALALIAPRHPERGEAILRQLEGARLALRAALARRSAGAGNRSLYLRHHRRTRAVLSACGRRVPRQVVRRRRRAESDRAREVGLRDPARTHGRQFLRRLRGARRGGRRARNRLARRSGRRVDRLCSPTRRACARWRASAGDTVERRAGAVDRSMAALAPLLPASGAAA